MMADSSRVAAALVITFFFFDLGVLFVFFNNASELERFSTYDFKIGTALQARNYFTFVEFFFFNIEIVFTCRAENHKSLPITFFPRWHFPDNRQGKPGAVPSLYLESLARSVK